MKRKRMRQLAKIGAFIMLASLICPMVPLIEAERMTLKIPREDGALGDER